jgi:hypothetical protein
MDFYLDKNTTSSWTVDKISLPKHEWRLDKKIGPSSRIRTKITFDKAAVKLLGREQHFKASDVPDDPDNDESNQNLIQEALANAKVWLSRGTGGRNRADGSTIQSSFMAEGPNDENDAAVAFISDATLSMMQSGGSSSWAVFFWGKVGTRRPATSYTGYGLLTSETITKVGSTFGSGYSQWNLYYTYASQETLTLQFCNIQNYDTTYFDVRAIESADIANVVGGAPSIAEYLYRDFVNNNGQNTLPD